MDEINLTDSAAAKRAMIGSWKWTYIGKELPPPRREITFDLSLPDYEALQQMAADWGMTLQTVLVLSAQKLIREWRGLP